MSQRGDSDKKALKAKDKKRSSSSGGKKDKKVDVSKQRKKSKYNSFGVFINRILKNVHSDVGITKNGMKVMDSFAHDLLDRIATEAGALCKYHKMQTMSSFHVAGAIKLVLPAEISQHAIEEGKRAHDALEKADNKSSHK